MPIRPNTETKLISALINVQDVAKAGEFGVTSEMFFSNRSEYEWLLSYPRSFGTQPSAEALCMQFEDFPYSEQSVDVSFICATLKRRFHHHDIVRRIELAGSALQQDDVEEAHAHLQEIKPLDLYVHDRPKNMLSDESILQTIEKATGIFEIPWPTVQEHTGGPANGDFWTLAARLKQGKTWSLYEWIADAMMQGRSCVLFSLEMPAFQALPRIHAILAHRLGHDTTYNDLQGAGFDPIGYRKLLKLVKTEVDGDLYVRDTSHGPVSSMHIQSQSRGFDFAAVDHLGLMASASGGRTVDDWRMAAANSNIMKELAQSLNIPIIGISQINREGESTGWKPPKAVNISNTDMIGQDSDVIITMKRRTKHVAIYSIEENRRGEAKILFHTRFDPKFGRFEEISWEKAQDLMNKDRENEEQKQR